MSTGPNQPPGRPGQPSRAKPPSRTRQASRTLRRKATGAGARAAAIRVTAVLLGFGVLIVGGSLLPAAGSGPLFGSEASRADENTKPVRVPVEGATLACPESAYAKDETSTEISAIAAPSALVQAYTADDAAEQEGTLRLSELGGGKPVATSQRRDELTRYTVEDGGQDPFLAEGSGALAPGTTAGQTTRSETGALRGLAEAPCASPGSEFWFVGAGSQVGRSPRLYLTNADDTRAQVDVVMYDENGAVDTDSTRGLIVEPRAQRVVKLDSYAPESEQLAVRVTAARGRVVAALRDDQVDTQGRPTGVDWIPASTAPAKRLVVPGVAPGDGRRTLTVVAPPDHSAVVDLNVLGKDGSFLPAEHGRLEVPADTVREVPLEGATREQAAAIQISSDVPVTASVRSELGSDPVRDMTYASTAAPLTGPAVVPATYNGDDREGTLLLSAIGGGSVGAEIVQIGAGGRTESPKTVTVASGTTVGYELPTLKSEDRYSIVVTPSEPGKLLGSRVQVDSRPSSDGEGDLISSWPLLTGPTTTVRPVAAPDLGSALRR